MTTCAEVQSLLRTYREEADRVALVSARVFVETDGGAAARDIVALANRDGGRVLIGVGRDGGFDLGGTTDTSGWGDVIERLCRNRIAPPIECGVERIECPEGRLVVVAVARRRDAPHAVVSRTGEEAGARLFLVRSSGRSLPASDEQLDWMFRCRRDPAIHARTLSRLVAAPSTLSWAGASPAPRGAATLVEGLASLAEDQRGRLEARDGDLAKAALEIVPYLVARAAGDARPRGWREVVDVPIEDVPVPQRTSAVGAAGADLRALLVSIDAGSFKVPRGADLQVDHHRRSSRLTLTHPAFTAGVAVRFVDHVSFESDATAVGAHEIVLEIVVEGSLAFPDRPGSAGPGDERFLTRLARRVEIEWGSGLPDGSEPG